MKTLVIFRKELISIFLSRVAWVVAVLFALATAIFFERSGLHGTEATLGGTFLAASTIFVVAFPALTMGSIADEMASGTIETLATDPVRDAEIVLGKFFAVLAFFTLLLAPLPLYYLLLRSVGARPDLGPVLSGLAGLWLAGGLCAAVGIFASALTSDHLIGFVVAFLILLVFRVIGAASTIELPEAVAKTLVHVSLPYHLVPMIRGHVALEDLVFFVSTTALFLFLATRCLEARRWA